MNMFGARPQGGLGAMAGAGGGMGGAPGGGGAPFDAQRLARLQALRSSAPQFGGQQQPAQSLQRPPMAPGAQQARPMAQQMARPVAPPQRQPMSAAQPVAAPQGAPPPKPRMGQPAASQMGPALAAFNARGARSMF